MLTYDTKKTKETSLKRFAGDRMALYVTPSSCPASPARVSKNILPPRNTGGRTKGSTAENPVASIKSRPPSGIMFAVFRAVKQFLSLLTLFSLEIYSSSKMPKNKAKLAYSEGSLASQNSFGSRKKVSLIGSFQNSLFGSYLAPIWAANIQFRGARSVTCSIVHL